MLGLAEFEVCLASFDDLELLVRHRVRMWVAIRTELAAQADEMTELTRDWIRKMLLENRLIGFIAKTGGDEVAGSGCIWLREEQPRFVGSWLVEPYLMSMYTEERFRRKGVATLIVKSAIGWCKSQGYAVISLHASDAGAAVYEPLGFERSSEMRLCL